MAKPGPYPEKRGKGDYPWRVRWPLPPNAEGIVKWDSASGFATREDAIAHGWAQLTDIARGVWIDPRKARTPFGEFAEAWLPAHRRSLSTDDSRRYLLDTVILPRWAPVELGKLNWDETREWANALTMPRNTVDHALSLMSTMLTSAADAQMIGKNPLFGRRRHTNTKRQANLAPKVAIWPTPAQAAAIAARMPRIDGLMLLFQVFMGPRYGELSAIHRKTSLQARTDVVAGKPWTRTVMVIGKDDGSVEEAEVVRVDDDGVEKTVRELRLGPPKNEFSVREVDLPPFLDDMVKAYLKTWEHDFLCATTTGEFRHLSNYNARIRKATAGWPESPRRRGTSGREAAEPILPGLSSHGNRHAHATMTADAGLPETLRRHILGQKMPGMAGVYEHPTAAMRKARVDFLEAAWWCPGVADVYLAGPNAIQVKRRGVEP